MKLFCSYNVYSDSVELLEGSIRQIRDSVSYILCVVQETSNFGEKDSKALEVCRHLERNNIIDAYILFNPDLKKPAYQNETQKRNIGLQLAKQLKYDYILQLDCDEYYNPNQFKKAKKYIEANNIDASYISLYSYFKSPELRFKNKDNYFVPFIHKVYKNSANDPKYKYPVLVDRTRKISQPQNAKFAYLDNIVMHHYTWIRKDIIKKIDNSSARANIKKDDLLKDYENAVPGYYVDQIFRQDLIQVENYFNIKI